MIFNFGLGLRVDDVEVGLEIVEAVEVQGLGDLIGPRRLLHSGKTMPIGVRRFPLRPDVPVAVLGVGSRRAS